MPTVMKSASTIAMLMKCGTVALLTAGGAQVSAQSSSGSHYAVCEVRTACFIFERFTPGGNNEPYCEVALGNREYIGGACINSKLEGTVMEVTWADGRPTATLFKLFDSGRPASRTLDYVLRHEAGRVVIEKRGVSYDCGAIGTYAPRSGSEAECENVRDAFGDTPFTAQAPAKQGPFRVRQYKVIAAPGAVPAPAPPVATSPQVQPAPSNAAAPTQPSQTAVYMPPQPAPTVAAQARVPSVAAVPGASEAPNYSTTLPTAECIQRAKTIQLAWREEGDQAGGDTTRLAAAERRAQLALKDLFQTKCSHFPDAAGWVARADMILNSPSRGANAPAPAAVPVPVQAPRQSDSHQDSREVPVGPVTSNCITYTALHRTESGMQWFRFTNHCGVAVNVWHAPSSSGVFGSLAALKPGASSDSWFPVSGPNAISRLPYIACRAQEGEFEVHLNTRTMQCFYRRR